MTAQKEALVFKAWAQENHLLGREFPVNLNTEAEEKDALFDGLKVTAASSTILNSKHLLAVGFNESTSEVIVFTAKKITLKEQKSLPQTLGENCSVKYIHGGHALAGVPNAGIASSAYMQNAQHKYTCGSSIHPVKHIGAGTLGCLVKNEQGEIFGLSNNHVTGLCNYALHGEKILAPGHLDVEANGLDPFTIGYHFKAHQMVSGVPDNVDVASNSDAALIRLVDEASLTSYQRAHYDTPQAVQPIQPGYKVSKVGRTTDLTHGQVVAQLTGPFPVTYNVPGVGSTISYFDPVYVVQGVTGPFSAPGDSGALVVAEVNGDRYAVGLVFAGDAQGLSYVLPLNPILDSLKVKLVSGHNP